MGVLFSQRETSLETGTVRPRSYTKAVIRLLASLSDSPAKQRISLWWPRRTSRWDVIWQNMRLWLANCVGFGVWFGAVPKTLRFLRSLTCFRWKTILTWSWTLTVVDCAVHLSVTPPRISSSLWQETNACTFINQTNVAPALPSRDKSWLFTGIGGTLSLSPRTERLLQSRAPRNRWVLFAVAASRFPSFSFFPVKLCSLGPIATLSEVVKIHPDPYID